MQEGRSRDHLEVGTIALRKIYEEKNSSGSLISYGVDFISPQWGNVSSLYSPASTWILIANLGNNAGTIKLENENGRGIQMKLN